MLRIVSFTSYLLLHLSLSTLVKIRCSLSYYFIFFNFQLDTILLLSLLGLLPLEKGITSLITTL